MNKEAIDLIIKKNPRLKSQRERLEEMQPGTYCIHRTFGVGHIRDFDEVNQKLIIDFADGKEGHPMDPAFCVGKLVILPGNHILVRQRQEPDEVEALIKKGQTDLIAEILSGYPEMTASPLELEGVLRLLLGPDRFKKWWTATKKLLVKDPRIAVPSKKTDPYVLREEPLKPEQEVLEDFYAEKNPKKKILLAEKLYQLADSVEEIASDLPQIFQDLTEAVGKASRQMAQAERLHGVWVRNDLGRQLHEDVEVIEPTSKSILLETEDLSELADELPSNYYKRFLDLVTRTWPDTWKDQCISLLRNSSGKFTSECINFLCERDCETDVAGCFRRWLDEQSIKGPMLYWIVKNRNSRKYARLVEGLIGPRLLAAILMAVDNEALQNTGNRRITLADVLSDDPDLIPDLLAEASGENARDLAQTLLMNQGFEDLTKKSLLARFIKRFPSIQNLISGDTPAEQEEDALVVSKESFVARREELNDLIKNKIPANKEAIAAAREHGDLRENSEYKMARQDQETLLARKEILESELSRARQTDFTEATSEFVGIGSVVDLTQGSTGQRLRYSILGAWDSAPERDILSYKTPLGQALLSKRVGETVETNIDGAVETWTLQNIERWVDVADEGGAALLSGAGASQEG
ncbi:MAG: GreA/GreB family elongation factor [Opitutales bacterium]